MFNLLLIVGGIISFIIGSLIFLIGIGAITGVAGGILLSFAGMFATFIGIAAIINFIISVKEGKELNVIDIIELFDKDGQWTA